MTFAGESNEGYETIFFIAFAALAGLLFIVQVLFLQRLKILPAYMIAIVSLCFSYENIILAFGRRIDEGSLPVRVMYGVHAVQVSLLIMCIYETSYTLQEVRGANLLTIEFGDDEAETGIVVRVGNWSVWVVRLLAVVLCGINVIINFELIPGDYKSAGSGGYIYLATHRQSLTIWLALLPPMVLSIVALNTSNVIARYGREYSMGLSCLSKWRIMLLASLLQTAGQVPGLKLYPVTSNGGEIALLLGMTYFLLLAQQDIILTARFADFLHQSNEVFRRASRVEAPAENVSQQQQINLEDIYAEQVPQSEELYEQSRGAGAGVGAGVELVELNTAEF